MVEGNPGHSKLLAQLRTLPPKPPDSAKQSVKKRYSETVSKVVALAVAAELRERGLENARPNETGMDSKSGAERQMAGGIGAKKVDVTWSTEEAGLLLAFSIKTINFKDGKSNNYQKNLTNRRGDLLFESITLHRRFPYSVLVGLFILDERAASDATASRSSTFKNAHERLTLFTGRFDPAGRDEQYEHLYIGLFRPKEENEGGQPFCTFFRIGETAEITIDNIIDDALETVGIRNSDQYTYRDGQLRRAGAKKGKVGAAKKKAARKENP